MIYLAVFHYNSGPQNSKKVIDICDKIISLPTGRREITYLSKKMHFQFFFRRIWYGYSTRRFSRRSDSLTLCKAARFTDGEPVMEVCPISFTCYLTIRCRLWSDCNVDIDSLAPILHELSTHYCNKTLNNRYVDCFAINIFFACVHKKT